MALQSVPDREPELLWTVPELAKKLRVSQWKVRQLIDGGAFGTYHDVAAGGERKQRRVRNSELVEYLAAREITPRRTA